MTETLTLNANRSSVTSGDQIESRTETSAVSAPPEAHRPALPFAVPRAQLYYWSARWQADEHESLAEMKRGEGCEFDSMLDALKWLFDPED
jgi:hypothetical protein